MNKLTVVICLLIIIGCGIPDQKHLPKDKQKSNSSHSIQDTIAAPALRTELLTMYTEDQQIRKALIAKGVNHPDSALIAKMRKLDAAHTTRLKEIIREYGWPGTALVGKDGSNAAFIIIQHSDHETQEAMLPLVEAAYRAGDLEGQDYALLLDRVLVGRGEPQMYGTQILPPEQWQHGQPTPYPIREEHQVDQRRASVGLPPLSEYLALVKRIYFPEDEKDK